MTYATIEEAEQHLRALERFSAAAKGRRAVRVDRQALALARCSGILCVSPSLLGSTIALSAYEPEPMEPIEHHEEPENTKTAPSKVGVVRLEGPLAQRAVRDVCAYVDGYDAVATRFHRALAAEDVGSVLMVIDSPGGDVAGLEEAVARMRAMKADAGKPVVVYVDETAASAAYWLAAAVADRIVLPGAGRVGSIGCLGVFADESEAWAQEGIRWTVVRSPAGKADMMPLAPLTELATERLTATVEGVTARFYAAVASFREGVKEKALAKLNGDVLQGQAALDAGLADQIGSMDDAVALAASLARPPQPQAKKANPQGAAASSASVDPILQTAARARMNFAACAKASPSRS